MEHLFDPQLPAGERPDIHICIFPHLGEFLAVDLREERPRVLLLQAREVFRGEFFARAEEEFAQLIREENPFPFAQLMNLPLRVEEVIRDAAMAAILARLGLRPDGDDPPSVVVFIISGGSLAVHSQRVVDGIRGLLGEHPGLPALQEWQGLLSRLVAEENAALRDLNRQEMTEALRSDSPDYFTLWENRN